MIWKLALTLVLVAGCCAGSASAEDGYDLWLRYVPVTDAQRVAGYRSAIEAYAVVGEGPTIEVIRDELARSLGALLGRATPAGDPRARGTLVVATLDRLGDAGVTLDGVGALAERLGDEGFLLRATGEAGDRRIVVTARGERGLLYGAFALLRQVQTAQDLSALDLVSVPKIEHRVLQHWDNLDGTTERVYSETPRSIWWNGDGERPVPLERWRDYGRACASVGINVAVLNNVNAEAATLLPATLEKVREIADVLRPYGVRVALSANFASPLGSDRKFKGGPGIGALDTVDPTDPRVIAWWQAKIAEVYGYVPDFAGFLIKAGSEGMPGPEQAKQPAAVGANMLGRLLAPHGGIVMWRTFTWDDNDPDLVKRQYIRFMPQDAQFDRGNVFLQNKFGARDFMVREPFHPLFGGMTHTQMSIELQITQEYTGHDKYLMYWGPLWQEVFRSDTHAKGEGSTVARVIDGSLHGYESSQIAGVANISTVRNWTGHHFAQANWYAFGRFAWDPDADARGIAEEWVRMTWGNEPAVVAKLVEVMMASHEAVVNYVGPLGIAHTNTQDGAHYEPGASLKDYWQQQFVNPTKDGIGRDRTATSGSGATSQYQPPVAAMYESVETCPEGVLLWFHHVGWNHRLASSGTTVWQTLAGKYHAGVSQVGGFAERWNSLRPHIDEGRYAHVLARLRVQHDHARKFQQVWMTHFADVRRGAD